MLSLETMKTNTINPFLKELTNHDQATPFNEIKAEHFIPAIEIAIAGAKANVDLIKNNSAKANFENTILALETSGELVEFVSGIYFNLLSGEASEEHQALAQKISPILASYSSDISLDDVLFQKIKAVYDQIETFNLNAEQKKLVDKFYKDFTRNGALLNSTDKEKLRAIDQQLSGLGPQFSENVLKATNAFEMYVDDVAQLKGLPEGALEAAQEEAKAKGHPGKYLFTLHGPSVVPFLQYVENRELRKKMWTAYNSRSYKGDFDNQANVKKIVQLRHERAQLLGFKTHAEFVLQERMAGQPQQVFQFLNKLLEPSKLAAEKDLSELRTFCKSIGATEGIMPWDVGFYSEKLKEKKFDFNEEELRPYFKLENVVQGVFDFAEKLYDLKFKEIHNVPVYHPDVKVYEVSEASSGKYISLFYTDFFPRPTKKGGAWMTTFRDQGLIRGQVRRPHVSIVCNFTKPTATKPSLLSYDEVQTLFHEFGHALHGMLSECTYRTLSGTNVLWDFVELPSQIMENWVGEKEGLDLFAKHFETQQPIPADLVQKIKNAAQFQAGLMSLRQLSFGLLDMAWHSQDPQAIQDVDGFEAQATAHTRVLPKLEGTNSSCSFSHIFAGGYSAGYYSYKWAEVLDADAFEYFKEEGLFNREIGKKFKDNILSRGGTEHPAVLYKNFRGREPDPNALLKRSGLL